MESKTFGNSIKRIIAIICSSVFLSNQNCGRFYWHRSYNTAVTFYTGFTGLIVVCMLLLNLSIVNRPTIIIKKDTSLPWFKNQIKQQVAAIMIYAAATIIAFYSPAVALGLTFLMWVFWSISTKDTEDEEA